MSVIPAKAEISLRRSGMSDEIAGLARKVEMMIKGIVSNGPCFGH